MNTAYKFDPRTTALTRDDVNQLNKIFDRISNDVQEKPTPAPSNGAAPGPSPAVNTGFDDTISETVVNTKGGTVNTGGGTTSGAGATVQTDGVTIEGDGSASNPIELVQPVALGSGGTGIEQNETQQASCGGTTIAAGTAQPQVPITIVGVTTKSAIAWSLPNAPDGSWQAGIIVFFVCTANTVTPWLMNPTAGNITPIVQLLNIKVIL